jgi:hypothetical protein
MRKSYLRLGVSVNFIRAKCNKTRPDFAIAGMGRNEARTVLEV